MGASFAVGPHSTSASTFLLRVWSGYPSAARPFPTCCHPLHLRLPSAFAQVASVRMPSGARSPWAAADPCFHTGSRRYPSIRPMALVCAGHRPHSALSRLLLTAFASGLKKPVVGVTFATRYCSGTCFHMLGRTAARKGGTSFVACSKKLCAGCRPRPLPHIACFEKVPPDTPFPIMKAAVLHNRRSALGHLLVGYTANYPCPHRFAYFIVNSKAYALNFEIICGPGQ